MKELTRERYMAAKEGVLPWNAVDEMSRNAEGIYFQCPCGGTDHYASRKYIEGGVSAYLSPVLNCYETGKQWMVEGIPVAQIVRSEEELFLHLLKNAKTLVPKIINKRGYGPDTLFFLKDTHGIPEDVARDIWKASQG